VIQWTTQKPLRELTLNIYPDATGRALGTLYQDDGHTFEFLKGSFCRSSISYEASPEQGGILSSEPTGFFRQGPVTLTVSLPEIDEVQAGSIDFAASWSVTVAQR
jgi:hypothetical protein